MDLYFDRWDGHATTVEAFIACFAEASGRDLTDFFAWYEQAGTPRVGVEARYNASGQSLEVKLSQSTAPTPGQPSKRPLPIPVALGLLDEAGRSIRDTEVIVLDGPEKTVRFTGVAHEPVISALRGFSAPVNLVSDAPAKDAYVLMAADPDLFNRWEAAQTLARDLILGRAAGEPDEVGEARYAEALGRALADEAAEPAFRALLLALPSEPDLAVLAAPADPAALHEAREALKARIAVHLGEQLAALHGELQDAGDFSPNAAAAGRRALRNAAVETLAADPHANNLDRAKAHFEGSGNMTDAMGGLTALMVIGGDAFEDALRAFFERWADEPLVIDKWFQLQAKDPSEGALGRVIGLTAHPAFDAKTPNRLRALVSTFANFNPARFHDPSGDGYRFLADQVLAVDAFNPSVAARLVEPLTQWRRYSPHLAALMRAQLERIVATEGLSKNTFEQASKAIA
jgi:aminopeptidase N